MRSDCLTNNVSTDPYWWDQAPLDHTAECTSAIPRQVDVAIIGSGYTGLNAALVTARGGRGTLVLDADLPGAGCSTRNGGQISTSVKGEFEQLAKHHGREAAGALLAEGHAALDWIASFVADEGIDCDFAVPGRFHAAHSASAFEQMARSASHHAGGPRVEAEVVTRAEQRSELGTDAYHGGVVYPTHASLHPARYHAGLLARVREAGVQVVARCAMTRIERDGTHFIVHFERNGEPGKLRARDVVVGTNGYTGAATPWHRRRVIPIGSYIIATEALPAGLMDELMPHMRIISDSRKVVYYYRPSPDRSRIVFGGRVSAAETDPRVSGPRLHRELVALFPELAGTRVSHSWMGLVAYTFDELAHTGVEDGVHYAMGYCGSGVSMASYLGMRAGQKVLGLPNGRTAFDHIRFQTRPLYSGNPWFLSVAVNYYRWRDRTGR